jgi:hypothetical protein
MVTIRGTVLVHVRVGVHMRMHVHLRLLHHRRETYAEHHTYTQLYVEYCILQNTLWDLPRSLKSSNLLCWSGLWFVDMSLMQTINHSIRLRWTTSSALIVTVLARYTSSDIFFSAMQASKRTEAKTRTSRKQVWRYVKIQFMRGARPKG